MWWSVILIILVTVIVGKIVVKRPVEYHGPNSKDIVDYVFVEHFDSDENGEKYWRFVPEVVICSLDSSAFCSASNFFANAL